MNKRFLLAWLVVFVAWMAGSFVVHGALLHGEYSQLPNLFRSDAEAEAYLPLMLLAHVIMAAAGAWGRQGCTYVRLGGVDRGTLKRVMEAAWRRVASRELVEEME
jgi:hypothetical protein